ncbi:MAG TPA: signal peptidase II [Candidatus Limnocylindrales bacterium]|nr:signal peptidase II [Candidatus Limnocylindrales bacterium]
MSGKLAALLATLIFVVDQWAKSRIVSEFQLGESRPVIPDFFSLTHVRNRGGAFGLLADLPPIYGQLLFVVFAMVTVALLAWMLRRTPRQDFSQRLALTSVIGGAIGNLYDRIRFGEVVDFLDVYVGAWHWPAFNVADSFITIGVVLLFWGAVRPEPQRR